MTTMSVSNSIQYGETKVQDRMDTERKFKLEVLAVMRLCRVAIGENG